MGFKKSKTTRKNETGDYWKVLGLNILDGNRGHVTIYYGFFKDRATSQTQKDSNSKNRLEPLEEFSTPPFAKVDEARDSDDEITVAEVRYTPSDFVNIDVWAFCYQEMKARPHLVPELEGATDVLE